MQEIHQISILLVIYLPHHFPHMLPFVTTPTIGEHIQHLNAAQIVLSNLMKCPNVEPFLLGEFFRYGTIF